MKNLKHSFSALVLLCGITLFAPAYATKHIVTVANFSFTPSSLNVTVGDTVRWVWSSGSHTTTSNPGEIPTGAAAWDHPITSSNQTFEYKVTVAGSYNYVCTPHAPNMAGTFTATVFTPTLLVAPSNRDVTAAAGTTTFNVTSNSPWTVSSNASWCTVASGGNGNGTIHANYSENPTVLQRVATLTITVTGIPSQSVTVTQAGAAPMLTVTPSNQNVPATSGTTTFNLTSNTTWNVSSSETWCTVPSSGSGNATLTANYTANNTNLVRVATITITVSGLAPQTVTVTQAASTVGVSEHQLADLQVYPNPTTGQFKISNIRTYDQDVVVSILDMSGKQIFSRTFAGSVEYGFDISNEPKGYYFIRVSMGNSTQVRRIVLAD